MATSDEDEGPLLDATESFKRVSNGVRKSGPGTPSAFENGEAGGLVATAGIGDTGGLGRRRATIDSNGGTGDGEVEEAVAEAVLSSGGVGGGGGSEGPVIPYREEVDTLINGVEGRGSHTTSNIDVAVSGIDAKKGKSGQGKKARLGETCQTADR